MKIYLSMILMGLSACASKPYKADEFYKLQTGKVVPISVTRFQNKAAATGANGHCHSWGWFTSDLGNAFHDLTIDELSHYDQLSVLERNEIHAINDDEVNLVNAEKSEKIETGHFKRAKYTIVGAVNSFEYCAGDNALSAASALSQAVIGAGVRREKATVEVTMRLIDTKTGEVAASAMGRGEQSRTLASAGGVSSSFDIFGGTFQQSSLSDAIREAIHNGTTELFKKAKL